MFILLSKMFTSFNNKVESEDLFKQDKTVEWDRPPRKRPIWTRERSVCFLIRRTQRFRASATIELLIFETINFLSIW